jgi:hypothetical protein
VEDVPLVRALSLGNSFVGEVGFAQSSLCELIGNSLKVEVLDREMDA